MEVRELKTLLVLMRDYGLVELEIEDKKGKVRVVRAGVAASATATPPAAIAGPKEIAAKAFELRTAKEASKPTASSGNGARGSEPPAIAEKSIASLPKASTRFSSRATKLIYESWLSMRKTI